MTLTTLLVSIGIIAAILTGLTLATDKNKNLFLTYFQQFCGALFIFSGWVKAVDPLGTAYKMEQYFAEFESTFADAGMAWLAPIFPFFAQYATSFSVTMIVLEIVLGIMLLMGDYRKFTSWAFLLIVVFFTFLTGFTYLTGYVPNGVNFFAFSEWGEYVETNMKVTDCGCFGDFLVLKPFTSFMKDVFLLAPALLFLGASKSLFQTTSKAQRALGVGLAIAATLAMIHFSGYPVGIRSVLAGLALVGVQFLGRTGSVVGSTLITLVFCFSNFYSDIPKTDFRPFRNAVNVAERKALEDEAQSNVEVLAYKMTNKESGKVVELPFDQYLKEFKSYPKAEWKLEQIKTEPTVERTKISDFEASNDNGEDITPEILSDPNYSFMLIAYKLKGDVSSEVMTVQDTIYTIDTLQTADTFQLVKRIEGIQPRKVQKDTYTFDESYLQPWVETVNPVMNEAMAAGLNVFAITALADPDKLDDFRHASQSAYPFYQADDILLKTIVRSNPGIVLLKQGQIIHKWHHKKLPSFEEIKNEYMQGDLLGEK
ncbi:MAG: DoxX family protein [Saprospiraceae bacterium]